MTLNELRQEKWKAETLHTFLHGQPHVLNEAMGDDIEFLKQHKAYKELLKTQKDKSSDDFYNVDNPAGSGRMSLNQDNGKAPITDSDLNLSISRPADLEVFKEEKEEN